MTTITKIDVTTSTYQGKEKKSYLFTLSDGVQGYPESKGWDYKEGDAVTYTKESKKSSKGKEYNVLTLTKVNVPSSQPQPPAQATPPKVDSNEEIRKMKFDSRMQLVKLAHDLLISGKFEADEAKTHFVAWVALSDGVIDELFK